MLGGKQCRRGSAVWYLNPVCDGDQGCIVVGIDVGNNTIVSILGNYTMVFQFRES